MEVLTHRKIICNAGHESRPYAAGEILPRRCPICNQPYDRKYNHPILCYEDGRTEDDKLIPQIDDHDNSHNEQKIGSEIVEKKIIEDVQANVSRSDAFIGTSTIRRGRSLNPVPTQSPHGVSRREGQPSGIDVQIGQRRKLSTLQNKNAETISHTESSAIGLYNGGDVIPIPEEGCILGREGYASEYLAINPQVSRKHAFIKVDRLGNVFIRDDNSLNGTYVDDGNGRRKVKPHETVELKNGDTIWLGNHIFIIGTIS